MPQKDKVGKVKMADVKQIATLKIPDLNCLKVESAMSQVVGTARSMGLEVAD
jgi:large subunit ribosomal protein L11